MGRGMMFAKSVQFIIEHLPRMFVLENSHLILSYSKGTGTFIAQFQHMLEEQGYQVHTLRMDTHKHGLPQFRERAYIIGIHRTELSNADLFRPPKPRPPCHPNILLNPLSGTDNAANRPTGPGALHALQTALQRMRPAVATQDWFVDTTLSAKRVNKGGAPRTLLPALLHSR